MEFKVNETLSAGKALKQLTEKKYHEEYINCVSIHLYSGNVKEIYLIGTEFNRTDRNITAFECLKV